MCNVNSDIRLKSTTLKSSLSCYSNACILVKGEIKITGVVADAAARQEDERDKGVISKSCAPFMNCKSEINDTEIHNAKDIDIVIPTYNLIEYSENYSKTSGRLWQYYKDDTNDNLADYESFKSKIKITRNTPVGGNTKEVEKIVPLKYLSNFWRTLEMPLINCEANLILRWSATCVITNSTSKGKFEITDTKLCVSIVTLSTQDNAKLFHQLKYGFKRTINWNKYQSGSKTYEQNQHLNHLVYPSFQGVNRLFVFYFLDENGWTSHSKYYLPKVEIKDYNVKIDGRNILINK